MEIPNCLCTLPHLEILDISRNKISKLPERPGFLLKLRILNLSRNKIIQLPLWMGNMKNLELLQIYKNPIEWPPLEIWDCPSTEQDALNEWLVSLKNYLNGSSQNKTAKSEQVKPVEEIKEIQKNDPEQIQTLIDILQESLNIPWTSSVKVSFKIFHACNIFLSVLDTFFRTFLGQSRLETGTVQQQNLSKLQNSTMALAYCIMGLNPIDLAKNSLIEAVHDLKTFLNSDSVPKERAARFHMLGYYSMSSDIGKGILDLSNPEFKPDARSYKQEIISLGKSLLFSLSVIETPSDVFIIFLKFIDCDFI